MTGDNFEEENFEEQKTDLVEDNPVKEGEAQVGVILASKSISVRHYKGMTIDGALKQIKGSPDSKTKFRVLLNGDVSSLDTVIPEANMEIIFVGEWVLGNQKKI